MTKLLTFAILLSAVPIAAQEKPFWSKAAVPLRACDSGQRFKSPDSTITAELHCRPAPRDKEPRPYLHFILPDRKSQDVDLQSTKASDEYKVPQELLWAPDSKAFLVNGSENAYSGLFVDTYRIVEGRVLKVDVVHQVQRDMVTAFPPCMADGLDEKFCQEIARDPDFNVSGLAWVDGSSTIVVFAEIPCSSTYGGIMCQVRGYKVSAIDGQVLEALSANEMSRNWQGSMAWKMHIPNPPRYKPARTKSKKFD